MIDPANLSEVPQRDAEAPPPRAVIGRALILAALVGAAWVALALRRPEVTYHLAPLIAAGSAPFATRRATRPQGRHAPPIAGATSTVLTLVIAVALAMTDHLEGPSLWHPIPTVLEAIMLALIGGVWGTLHNVRNA